MKPLRIISWILIVLSLTFKLLHFPFAGPLILLGSLLLFIHAIIFLIKNANTNLPDTFFHLNISIWTIYFMFRFMFWPYAQIVFTLCVCATFIYIVLLKINESKISYLQIILFSYIFALVILAYTQSHRIYYFFNLNPLLNEKSNTLNYQAWDKYSWFLYKSEKKEEALIANGNAQYAVYKYLKINTADLEANMFHAYIMQHEEHIKKNNWTMYTQP